MAKESKGGATAVAKPSRRERRAARRAETDVTKMGRRRQIMETYKISKQTDPALGRWMLGAFLLFGLIAFALAFFLGGGAGGSIVGLVFAIVLGVLVGFLAMMIVFSRRAQAAAYKRIDGQLGAGARSLSMLRRGWKLDEMVGFTRQQDMVHRLVGPPGIVLIGEGNPNRLRQLLTSERRKTERVVSEVKIHEVLVGKDEGQVPVDKLVKHVRKLPKDLKPGDMTDILNRMKALDAQRPRVPLPHGPVPTSMKGMRGNARGR